MCVCVLTGVRFATSAFSKGGGHRATCGRQMGIDDFLFNDLFDLVRSKKPSPLGGPRRATKAAVVALHTSRHSTLTNALPTPAMGELCFACALVPVARRGVWSPGCSVIFGLPVVSGEPSHRLRNMGTYLAEFVRVFCHMLASCAGFSADLSCLAGGRGCIRRTCSWATPSRVVFKRCAHRLHAKTHRRCSCFATLSGFCTCVCLPIAITCFTACAACASIPTGLRNLSAR